VIPVDRRSLRWIPAAVAAGLCVTVRIASACGLEDPSSISMRRGSLNLAFPDSLHVGTAIWQAQLAGTLPRDPLALRDDLTTEARGMLRLVRATALLRQFAVRLAEQGTDADRPKMAVVLLGPVMWSRFAVEHAAVSPALHVTGPETGDVVIVTDIAVVEAIAAGSLGFDEALTRGLMRLYGPSSEVASARDWLTERARG
jgi:hypothetical protein